MSDDTASRELSRSAFQESFGKLEPVILAEWQQLDAGALTATGGELDKVVALIAERTAHTKVLVRRQLEELWQVTAEPPRRRKGATGANLHAVLPDAADDVLQELEQRTAELIRELRGGLLKDTRTRVKDNLLFSLLVTLGLGFIVGVIFTGWNFRRER